MPVILMEDVVTTGLSSREAIAAVEAAGARATPDRPLAWVALEANRTVHLHELVVRHWPGDGEPVMLARAHPHGASVDWRV